MDGAEVWVFEDDPDHVALLRTFCELAGARCAMRIFRDRAAVDALLEGDPGPPAAAVVDSNLIGISGLEVIERLRARHGPALPVAFYSSTPVRREQEAAVRAGATRVIEKNFGADGLPELLRDWLSPGGA
jgi:DNA-binding response OmpR family regulator